MTDRHRALVARSAPVIWRACATLAGPEQAERLTIRTFQRAAPELDRAAAPVPIGRLLGIARGVCAAEREPVRQPAAPVTRAWLESVLADLPAATREAFLLTALAGIAYTDVAVAYGCSLLAVRARVDAGRQCVLGALGPSEGGVAAAW